MIEGVPDPEEIPDPDDLLTPEELDERRKKRRYVIYAVLGFLVIMIVLITAFVSSGSGEEEAVESTESNIPHPLVEMAKLKSVPLQGYDVSRPLIANTPQELLNYIQVDGWIPSPDKYSSQGLTKEYTCLECPESKSVTIWLRTFPNNRQGRIELNMVLESAKKEPTSIVSEAAEMGSGGFIVNDNKTISYWFYYEPNVVARVDMFQSKQGTLQETREWAFRLNYSIWSVVGR